MPLKQAIQDDIKTAMKAREQARLSALRMLSAALKQKEVDERVELDDAAVIAIIEKQIKQRKEAATQFDAGGRAESAAAERFEIEVLSTYLPKALSAEEVQAEVEKAIAAAGALGPQDMGKVMAILKPALAGKADLSAVSGLVKKALTA